MVSNWAGQPRNMTGCVIPPFNRKGARKIRTLKKSKKRELLGRQVKQ